MIDAAESRVRSTFRARAAWFVLPSLLFACASPEVLMPKSAAAPAGVDLSGQWRLRPEARPGQPGLRDAIERTDGVDNRTILREMRQPGRESRESKAGLVSVFLKTGESLKITQTPYALFISFDRAIVEEYRFGENRPVNVGEAEAHRVSGWEGDAYVVETLGEKGMKLTDRYSLSPDRQRLIRRITLRGRDMQEVKIVQEFERQSG